MEKLTLQQIRDTVIVLLALMAFVVLLGNVIKTFKGWKKPVEDFGTWKDGVDDKLKKDNSRLTELEEGNRVICRGILALLSHEINGNSTDKLRESQAEITNYLIEK